MLESLVILRQVTLAFNTIILYGRGGDITEDIHVTEPTLEESEEII